MAKIQPNQLLTLPTPLPMKQRRLSREEIINKMENEQDAIVIKLLREIDQLKRENNYLKTTINYLNKKQQSNSNPKVIIKSEHSPVFESDDDDNLIHHQNENTRLNLHTPTNSRRSSMNNHNNITSNTSIYPIEPRPRRNSSISGNRSNSNNHVSTTTTTSDFQINSNDTKIPGNNNNNNRRRRRTSSSIYPTVH